jgi:hypothetical protein
MIVNPLISQESETLGGATHQVVLSHEDLTETTANTAQTINVLTVGLGSLVKCVAVRMVEDFEDASDSAFNTTTMTAGDGGSATRFLASMELNVNGTEVDFKAGVDTFYGYTSADTVDVFVNSMTGKSLSNIDAGEVHLYFAVKEFPARALT